MSLIDFVSGKYSAEIFIVEAIEAVVIEYRVPLDEPKNCLELPYL